MNLSVLEIKKLIHFWCRINTKTAKLWWWWWWHCQQVWSYLKIGPNPASFCLFSFFSNDKYITNTINEKSVDVLLGTWIWGGRMVGIDESTELWRHAAAPRQVWSYLVLANRRDQEWSKYVYTFCSSQNFQPFYKQKMRKFTIAFNWF